MFEVQYKIISPVESSIKMFALDGSAITSNIALDTIGGTAQALTGDFALDGTMVRWDNPSYGLYNQLGANDAVRVIYDKASE